MTSSNLTFFASAASSFQPAPYSSSSARSSFQSNTRSQRTSHDSLAVPPAGMDPHESDPGVVFIRPPFTDFPNSNLHSDGLSYGLMAENPEWFLRAEDFISQHNTNASAIAYPPHLEPPRGWCPAKKKDLKERGAEGWPEGEEPRLRCTFCRRTYAGVNAKSMWRRHVFEKHKIAMSNRRDGNVDRPRGRGSGKENRQSTSSKSQPDAHDHLVSIVVAPQTAPQNVSHKSRFRSKQVNATQDVMAVKPPVPEVPTSPVLPHSQHSTASEDEDEDDNHPRRVGTPPLTPHIDTSSDPPNLTFDAEDEEDNPPQIIVPMSPYNPLQTPSFRHSPPKLPSDQPWRFPSPSHPLHSRTRELPLAMIAGPSASPLLKAGTLVGASPLPMHSSPLSFLSSNLVQSGDLETPARPRYPLSKLAHKSYLIRTQHASPLSKLKDTDTIASFSVSSSPLSSVASKHRRFPSDVSEAWLTDVSLATPSDPLQSNNDPFSIYDAWPSITGTSIGSPARLPRGVLENESPVLRNGSDTLSSAIRFGIGLLEPFMLPKELDGGDADLSDLLSSPVKRGGKRLLDGKQAIASFPESSPPSKRRRVSSG
ncbi:hypothetical protein CVT24_000871 [Panaeolus cyanescens]|uniref:Uncharacterized protein n=1 Tax=Panaeolus cyanescens TaxID=181874 RepID=A0A409YCB4_9AGAR|nr:hypothetical protein CVT24_000871 [Panaeolus cyanescens]